MTSRGFSRRKPDTHKGDYGRIFVLAGSLGLSGAAVLCANSAMRSGAGLVTLGVPEGLYSIIAKKAYPEVMVRPLAETKARTLSLKAYPAIMSLTQKADLLAIGPGLSQNPQTQKLIRRIISNIHKPMVIDADALNALSGNLEILRINPNLKILTPHPGEFSRLSGAPRAYIEKNRETLAKKFAYDYNIILVLKGHNTVVASPDKLYINKTGNPGMATAGSGDVLSGIISALLGQGLSGWTAAKTGAYLHGLAGDIAAKEKT
ncbi:MAG: NAD(P)H-hydrate dehydratase, partial [Candidatus Omnitrophota bacterium]